MHNFKYSICKPSPKVLSKPVLMRGRQAINILIVILGFLKIHLESRRHNPFLNVSLWDLALLECLHFFLEWQGYFLSSKFISHLPQRIFRLTSFRLGVEAKLGQISNKLSRNWKKRPEYAMLLLNVTNILGPHFSGCSVKTQQDSIQIICCFSDQKYATTLLRPSQKVKTNFSKETDTVGGSWVRRRRKNVTICKRNKWAQGIVEEKNVQLSKGNKNKTPLTSPDIRLRITQSHRGKNCFTVYVFFYKWEMVFENSLTMGCLTNEWYQGLWS